MANIANDAAFEALLVVNEARYADTTNTIIQGPGVDMTDRFILSTPTLGSNNNTSTFMANNCFLNFSVPAAQGSDWQGGDLTITNSTINYSGGNVNFQWPGFSGIANNSAAAFADRPIYNFNNTTILSSRAGSGMTLQLQSAAPVGAHNFNGMTLGNGVAPIAIFGMTDWVGVTFSGHDIDSNTSITTNTQAYFRFDHPGGSGTFRGNPNNPGLITARWMGMFGCDFSAWTRADVVHLNNGTAANSFTWNRPPTGDQAQFWVVDGTFSNQQTMAGIQFGTNLESNDVRTGISFNPMFRNSSSPNLEQVTDVELGFGDSSATTNPTNRAYLCTPTFMPGVTPTTKDNTAYPVAFNTSDVLGRRTPSSDNGYVIEVGTPNTDQSTLAGALVPVPTNAGVNIPYWSYANKSYSTTDGTGLTVNPTPQPFIDGFVFGNEFQNVDIEVETALNGNSKAQAETLIVNGLSDLQDAFAVAKSLYVDGRHAAFSPFASTAETFDMGNQNVTLTTANACSLADGGAFNIQTNGLFDLSALTFAGNQLSVTNGTHVFQQGTLQFTTLDLAGISFGVGVFISGGTVTNINANNFDNPGAVTFTPITVNNNPVSPILNIENLRDSSDNTADITDWNTNGAATITADSALIVNVTSAQQTQFTEGTNITFNVAPIEYAFTFDSDAFRGRAAIVHRTMGTNDAWNFGRGTGSELLYDFTSTAPSIPNIDSNHAGFTTANQEVAVVTVGAAYTLTFTTITPATAGFTGTMPITVRTTLDQLWNQTAANNLAGGVTMDLEDLVTEGDSDGSIAITVKGSTPNDFLTTDETNGLLGLARNDVDYITEILDGGRTTDFITFRQDTGGSTVDSTLVQFRKQATDSQQVVSDVQGFMSRTVSGVADVLNYPNVTGISTTDIQNAVQTSTTGRIITAAQATNSGFLKANSPTI